MVAKGQSNNAHCRGLKDEVLSLLIRDLKNKVVELGQYLRLGLTGEKC